MKIVVDIYGGDHSPHELVKGCVMALEQNKEFSLVLVGNQAEIQELLKQEKYDQNRK